MSRMDDEWAKFFTDVDGNVRIRTATSDFCQRLAEGAIAGYSFIEKFGENPEITQTTDPEDIWDGGGIYTWSTTADIDRLSSSDNSDTQSIMVVGLDANWEEVIQFVTLTGQTPVALTTTLIRVYRMRNMGTNNIAGDVYCFVNGSTTGGIPDTTSDIRAMIRGDNNQTLMCIYTVPADKTGYLCNGWAAISRAGGVVAVTGEFSARSRLFGGVFAVQARSACMTTGNSGWDRMYRPPLQIPARTDILLRSEFVSDDCAMSGGFTVILKDN